MLLNKIKNIKRSYAHQLLNRDLFYLVILNIKKD